MTHNKSLVWFRRDLRIFDHAALHHALTSSNIVYCAFIYDEDILESLPRADRRVEFIHAALAELDHELRQLGGYLIVRHGRARADIVALAAQLEVDAVFVNEDYEPQAIARDQLVAGQLQAEGRRLLSYKDQLVFDKRDVLTLAGQTFSVFTPYKNAWLKRLAAEPQSIAPYTVEPLAQRLAKAPPAIDASNSLPSLAQIGFEPSNLAQLAIPTGMSGAARLFEDFLGRIHLYDQSRNLPAVKGPSYLSVHLRFGTISVRYLVRSVIQLMANAGTSAGTGAPVWLSELIWREFYAMILYHHPHVCERAFKPAYDAIEWECGPSAEAAFKAWCAGRTGYPLVDAAMAQLNQTGFMHNRLRMVSACFLIKDLGIDWRWGERYFAQHLNDFELASNNGGWQWAASSGCDAQPWFRIFNPLTQSEKFDSEGRFIRRYLPQLAGLSNQHIHAPWKAPTAMLEQAGVRLGDNYPEPMVQHEQARKHTLERYGVLKGATPSALPG
jgi:deoxyribodipyrimidine photo-lyase